MPSINKGIDIIVEVYYDLIKDLSLIPGENTSWEGKSNYAWKGLTSFPNNKEGDILDKKKWITIIYGKSKKVFKNEYNRGFWVSFYRFDMFQIYNFRVHFCFELDFFFCYIGDMEI